MKDNASLARRLHRGLSIALVEGRRFLPYLEKIAASVQIEYLFAKALAISSIPVENISALQGATMTTVPSVRLSLSSTVSAARTKEWFRVIKSIIPST